MQDNDKPKRERVSELDFGYAMLTYDSKGQYPLEYVSFITGEDKQGKFYWPLINDYCDFEQEYFTGTENGYSTREQALRCVGRCWDKALSDIERRESEGE